MSMPHLALALSFCIGFLSLSQEIVWVRIVAFVLGGRPHAFATVLTAFLVGIAAGAIAGRVVCGRSTHLVRDAGRVLLVAAAADFGVLFGVTFGLGQLHSNRGLIVLVPAIALTAALKGVLFPIVHHLGSSQAVGRVGRSVSRVYLGNVLGSTFGPIVTGFILLDLVSVEPAFALIGLVTAALGALTLALAHALGSGGSLGSLAAAVPAAVLLATGVLAVLRAPDIVTAVAGRTDPDARVLHIIQNRHGIIHVLSADDPRKGDVTRGGNVYDGNISVDMTVNENGLDRAYMAVLLHARPRRVLVVGMSTGAWTRVLTGVPGIDAVDVVEINPGYLRLVGLYPAVAPLLTDPRVKVHIDDGRRWLRAHPEARYDLIIQNTTFHWRAYSSLLLSSEYLQETRQHLSPGGLVAMNTTGSHDAYLTAAQVFPHAVAYRNFVYMSELPLARRADAREALRQCRIGDAPAFPEPLFEPGRIGRSLVDDPLETVPQRLAKAMLDEPPRVITDLNLVPEFRHGRPPLRAMRPLLPPTPHKE